MGRLIDETDLMNLLYALNDARHDLFYAIKMVSELPTVEAIPKAEVKKFLEEGTKNISNNVLAIVREDYIHKAEYETRLKADMVAMLKDIQLEIEELDSRAGYSGDGMPTFSTDYIRKKKVNEIIQQKINELKAESEPHESDDNDAERTYLGRGVKIYKEEVGDIY